jgi:hypothetical protein
MEQPQSLSLDLVDTIDTSAQQPTLQSSSYSETPETSYIPDIMRDNHSTHYAPYSIANFELSLPNIPTSLSDPRSTFGLPIAYNKDIGVSSHITPCSYCFVGLRCVAHTPESDYLSEWY